MSSRREGRDRDSDSRRHRSRFDQEPSPKRSRKHGGPETERPPATHNSDSANNLERDLKHHRRQQDAATLDAPSSAQDSKSERTVCKESENITAKDDAIKVASHPNEGSRHRSSKQSSNPTDAPRSRSSFQHDERGSARQVDRSSSYKARAERGWWKDVKEQGDRTTTTDKQLNDERSRFSGKQNDVWRHDRYFEVKDPKPPVKKRTFREEKIPVDTEKVEKAATELIKTNPTDPVVDNGRKNERAENTSRNYGRYERPNTGERDANRGGETWRGRFSSRDKYYGNGDYYRGKDRLNPRQGHQQSRVVVEKWKHDLYDEANKSPTPKNEEDQIAKIEALLSK